MKDFPCDTIVPFETAKLLKEKCFYGQANYFYCNSTGEYKLKKASLVCGTEYVLNDDIDKYLNSLPTGWTGYAAPTIYTVIEWLISYHGLMININPGCPYIEGKHELRYFWSIVKLCGDHLEYPMDDDDSPYYREEISDTFKQAMLDGINYILNNLL